MGERQRKQKIDLKAFGTEWEQNINYKQERQSIAMMTI